jgi:hypothetical protein
VKNTSLGAIVALATVTACNPDVLDVDVDLASQRYVSDFGASTGAVPIVPCAPAMPEACAVAGATTVAADQATVTLGCDASTSRCFASARARDSFEVDVLRDDDFVSKVARRAVTLVRTVDLAYTVPVNTLSFDVPRVDLYVGPLGTTKETDPGVAPVDTIPPIAAGTTFLDPRRHLVVADGSPARAFIVSSIQTEQPFVFVVVATTRVEAGAALPGGALEVDVYPHLLLGVR